MYPKKTRRRQSGLPFLYFSLNTRVASHAQVGDEEGALQYKWRSIFRWVHCVTLIVKGTNTDCPAPLSL